MGRSPANSKFERLMWAERGFSAFQWSCLLLALTLGIVCGRWLFPLN
jgi:hypothetical protein